MADPFKDITLEEFEETAKAIDTRQNIIETNPGDKVKVVKPKTEAGGFVESLRNDRRFKNQRYQKIRAELNRREVNEFATFDADGKRIDGFQLPPNLYSISSQVQFTRCPDINKSSSSTLQFCKRNLLNTCPLIGILPRFTDSYASLLVCCINILISC